MRIDSPQLVGTAVISGTLEVTGSVGPGDPAAYDLGTYSKPWRTIFSNALSGSLTKLADGSTYLIAGSKIGIATGSNGSVTISSTSTGADFVAGSTTQVQFNESGNFGASSNLVFDNTNSWLGIGTSSPRAGLDVDGGSLFSGQAALTSSAYSGLSLQFGYQLATTSSVAIAPTTSLFGANTILSEFDMTNGSTVNAFYAVPKIVVSTAGQALNQNGVSSAVYRSYANDLATNANMRGSTVALYMQSSLGSNTTQTAFGFNATIANNKSGHTLAAGSGVEVAGIAAGPITTFTGLNVNPVTGAGTVSTLYGLRLQDNPAATVTNRWGISQEDTLAKNQFLGNAGVGVDPGIGKVIAALTLTNAGTGAVNGTYSQAALTGGSGSGATADIVVAGNVVTSLVLRSPGQGYVVGDALSTAAVGGSGFVFTVASTASILRSNGTAIATRIGAGTGNPRAALDAVGGMVVDGAVVLPYYNTAVSNPIVGVSSFQIGVAGSSAIAPTGNNQYTGLTINPLLDTTASTSQGIRSVFAGPIMATSPAGYTGTTTGFQVAAYRREAGDLATAPSITGFAATLGAGSGVGSVSTNLVKTLSSFIIAGNVGHTITAGTHLDLSWTATGNITTATGLNCNAIAGAGTVTTFYGVRIQASTTPTITNRWGISQEDALARNVLSGATVIGAPAGTSPATGTKLDVLGLTANRAAGTYTIQPAAWWAADTYSQLVVDSTAETGGITKPTTGPGYVAAIASIPRYDLSLRGTTVVYGIQSQPILEVATLTGTSSVVALDGTTNLNQSAITAKTIALFGTSGQASISTVGATVTASLSGVSSNVGTFAANVVAHSSVTQFEGTSSTFSGAAHTITNFYGLRLRTTALSGGATITNRWGISQEDTLAKNYFAGKVGIGTSNFGDTFTVNGTASVTGSILPGNTVSNIGSSAKLWSNVYAAAFSGSLTRLSDGSSYLIAGNNVTITTGSNGSITIDSSGGGGGGAVTGTGTSNYITKWSSSSVLSDSGVYDSGTGVGIGVTSFSARLFVSGTAATSTAVFRAGTYSQIPAVLDVQNNAGTSLFFVSGSGEIGLNQNISSVQTAAITTTTLTATTLLSVSSTIFRSAEFIVQGSDVTGTKFTTAKILAIQDGTTTSYTEYGAISLGGLAGTFSVTNPSAGTFLLQVTPTSTNSTTWKVTAILTKV